MIHGVEVTNYQSLGDLRLKLGRFTVITGRTGAGKSAFIRSIKALVFNVRGTKDVMHGESAFAISMVGDEDDRDPNDAGNFWSATIRRGTKDHYQLAIGVWQKTYTKLAGKVPEAVSDTLRLGEINFATQFDRPYLLDSTGGDVARVLGKLTNVTVLFKAAQEANRRKLAVSTELKLRQTDLAALQEQIGQYSSLGQEHLSLVSAEMSLARLRELSLQRKRLGQFIVDYDIMWRRLYSLKPLPEPPSLETLDALTQKRAYLKQLTSGVEVAQYQLTLNQQQEIRVASEEESCKQELAEYVSQWGVCPECGQPVQKH